MKVIESAFAIFMWGLLIVATALILTATCADADAQCFSRVCHRANVLKVQQFVPPILYYPAGYQQQTHGAYQSRAEVQKARDRVTAQAVIEVMREEGLLPLRAKIQASHLHKCAGCHNGGNATATDAWQWDGVLTNATQAAKVQAGILTHGMAKKAKLTEAQTLEVFQETTRFLLSQQGDSK